MKFILITIVASFYISGCANFSNNSPDTPFITPDSGNSTIMGKPDANLDSPTQGSLTAGANE